eukprot:GILK01011002.1.p1 GENE.GILK01011002.1~~GILK01011002.1.p1  ORF type:complete len:204 (-),score=45.87 GILK01011002.1:135-746(-)
MKTTTLFVLMLLVLASANHHHHEEKDSGKKHNKVWDRSLMWTKDRMGGLMEEMSRQMDLLSSYLNLNGRLDTGVDIPVQQKEPEFDLMALVKQPFMHGFHLDIAESDKAYHLKAEMPGFKKDNISVEIEDDLLKISGEKLEAMEDTKVHRRERTYGKFQRVLKLPQTVDTDTITAKYADGILSVDIAKKQDMSKGKAKPIMIS